MRWKQTSVDAAGRAHSRCSIPERFLERTFPYVGWLFGWFGACLWLLVVVTGTVLAAVHWSDLTENIVDRTLTPREPDPAVVRLPGGEGPARDSGTATPSRKPAARCTRSASCSWCSCRCPMSMPARPRGFRDKYQRMLVGAAGIMVELFLGALALFVWLNVEPGAVHAIAYNVMLISGVSTLLFNGNPLLRFDGYYVLADALEIPNLGTRANKYLGYLVQRYLFGRARRGVPGRLAGRARWFVVYGIAAFIYRMFIMFAIILYIGGKFFAIGVLLAIWAISHDGDSAVAKNLSFRDFQARACDASADAVSVRRVVLVAIFIGAAVCAADPALDARQGRDLAVGGVPGPRRRRGLCRATAAAVRQPGTRGSAPDRDARSVHRGPGQSAGGAEEGAREPADGRAGYRSRCRRTSFARRVTAIEASLQAAHEQIDDLVIRSPRDGTFVVPQEQDLPDRLRAARARCSATSSIRSDRVHVRAVVSQDEIGLVRGQTRAR